MNDKNKLENEAELIEKAINDDKAFEVLYDFYFEKIYFYTFKRIGHKETTEDIVSEIFTKIFLNLNKYKSDDKYSSFSCWVYKIATNSIIDYYRKHKIKEVELDKANTIEDKSKNQEEKMLENVDSIKIKNCIKSLPEKYQKIINLKFFGELSNEEIAETLNISKNNAGVLIYRALKSFKKIYK